MENKYLKELNKQKKILEKDGFKVAYICVYGSQNYGMELYTEDYMSDLDMKAIVVPTLDDLVNNAKPYSKIHKTEWGEVDVKDIRKWTETLCKGNPTYLETIYTDYYIIDEEFYEQFGRILSMRDELTYSLRAQAVRAMYGMMCEKYKALTHPYPSIAHKIEKWGYDGKQAHHVFRLLLLMIDYFANDIPYKDCLGKYSYHNIGEQTDIYTLVLKGLKENTYALDKAIEVTESYMEKGKKFKDKILSEIDEQTIDYSAKTSVIGLSKHIIKSSIENNILIDCR